MALFLDPATMASNLQLGPSGPIKAAVSLMEKNSNSVIYVWWVMNFPSKISKISKRGSIVGFLSFWLYLYIKTEVVWIKKSVYYGH